MSTAETGPDKGEDGSDHDDNGEPRVSARYVAIQSQPAELKLLTLNLFPGGPFESSYSSAPSLVSHSICGAIKDKLNQWIATPGSLVHYEWYRNWYWSLGLQSRAVPGIRLRNFFRLIAEEEPDVVFLQEVFDEQVVQFMRERLQYQYAIHVSGECKCERCVALSKGCMQWFESVVSFLFFASFIVLVVLWATLPPYLSGYGEADAFAVVTATLVFLAVVSFFLWCTVSGKWMRHKGTGLGMMLRLRHGLSVLEPPHDAVFEAQDGDRLNWLVRRGYMHAEVTYRGRDLRLISSHLNAYGPCSARIRQLDEIMRHCAATGSMPTVMGVDANADVDSATMRYVVREIDAVATTSEVPTWCPSRNELAENFAGGQSEDMHADYFIATHANKMHVVDCRSVTHIAPLSDHFPLVGTLKFFQQ